MDVALLSTSYHGPETSVDFLGGSEARFKVSRVLSGLLSRIVPPVSISLAPASSLSSMLFSGCLLPRCVKVLHKEL
jgi:hypothetical protein